MDEQIAQFVAITGLDSERAKFFVESAKGDVETALSTFYETEGAQDEAQGDDDDVMASETGHAPAPAAAAAAAAATPSTASTEAYTGPRTLSGAPAPAGSSSSSWGKQATSKSSSSAARAGSGFSASGGMGGIATLHDMRNDDDDGDDDEDEDGNRKKPAHLFTGGEKSGLNVQNPDREQDDGPEIVQNILKKAAEGMKSRGGEGGGQARAEPSQSSSSSFAFTGRGRMMGGPSEEEEAEAQTAATPQRGAPFSSADMRALRSAGLFPPNLGTNTGNGDEEEEEDEEIATRHITFWQDGFSIEDGPLCRYDDPQHAETLALINSNRAPLHLLNVKFGQRVDLQVEKKTHKKYQPPPPKPMKPFEGQGNRLGAPAPSMSGAPAASSSSAAPATAPAASSSSSFQVNPNEPTTRVQIRLGDGQKLVAKFNHTHTVADIRRYINASHPGMAERDYSLQASFPPVPLTDEEQTLSDVGLINSVVTQKWD